MSREVLRIATRSSPLAIWQAEYVQQRLEKLQSGDAGLQLDDD